MENKAKPLKVQRISIYNPNDYLHLARPNPEPHLGIEGNNLVVDGTTSLDGGGHGPLEIKSSTSLMPPKKKGRFIFRQNSKHVFPASLSRSNGSGSTSEESSNRTHVQSNNQNFYNRVSSGSAVFSVSGTQQLVDHDGEMSSLSLFGEEFPTPKYFDAYISGKWHSTETSWRFLPPLRLRLSSSVPEKQAVGILPEQKDADGQRNAASTDSGSRSRRKLNSPVYKLGKLPETFESRFRIKMPVYLTETANDSVLEMKLNELEEVMRNHPPTKRLKLDIFAHARPHVDKDQDQEEQKPCSGESPLSPCVPVQSKDSLDFLFHESSLSKQKNQNKNKKENRIEDIYDISSSETDDEMKCLPDEEEENIFEQADTRVGAAAVKTSSKLVAVHAPRTKVGKVSSLFLSLRKKKVGVGVSEDVSEPKQTSFKGLVSRKSSISSSFRSFLGRKNRELSDLEIAGMDSMSDKDQKRDEELKNFGFGYGFLTEREEIQAWRRHMEAKNVTRIIPDSAEHSQPQLELKKWSSMGLFYSSASGNDIQNESEPSLFDSTPDPDETQSQSQNLNLVGNQEQGKVFVISTKENLEVEKSWSETATPVESEEHGLNGNASEIDATSTSRPQDENKDKDKSFPEGKSNPSFFRTLFSVFQRKEKVQPMPTPIPIRIHPPPPSTSTVTERVEKKSFFQKLSLIFKKPSAHNPQTTNADNQKLVEKENPGAKHVDSVSLIRKKRWKLFQETREFYHDSLLAYKTALTRASVTSTLAPPPFPFPSPTAANAPSDLNDLNLMTSRVPTGLNLGVNASGLESILGLGLGYKSTVSESVILPAISRRKRRLNQDITDIDQSIEEKPKLKGILKKKL